MTEMANYLNWLFWLINFLKYFYESAAKNSGIVFYLSLSVQSLNAVKAPTQIAYFKQRWKYDTKCNELSF